VKAGQQVRVGNAWWPAGVVRPAILLLLLPWLLCTSPGAAPAVPAASVPLAAMQPVATLKLHFRASLPDSAGKGLRAIASLSPQVLSAEERQFLKDLPELRVAVPTPPNRPYETVSPEGEVGGIFPDMLMALASTFGLRVKAVAVPSWSAALLAVKRREVDLIMTVGVTAERMDYLAFTLGATPVPGALFARKGAKVDLAHARIALERDFVTNDWVSRQFPQATVVTVDTTGQALRAVGEGRADAYLGGLLEAVDWLTREPVPGVEVNQLISYGTGFYHFGVRKDWAPLAGILNKGIQSLRERVEDDLAALALLPTGETVQRVLAVNPAEAELLARLPVWRVGAVRGLPLLNDVDERGLHNGIAAEYTEQVARRLGVAVQVRAFDSVAQMIDGLRRGDVDLVPFITRTERRAQEFAFSAAYVEMPYSLVARDDSPLYWNLASLAGKRLALALQHPLRDHLAAHHPDIVVVDAPPGMGAMDMVLAGDADAAVEVKLFANLRINAPGGHRLRVLTELSELPAQFHMAAQKNQPVLIGLVDRALADISPAERLRMVRRWVAVDLQPAFPWRRYTPVLLTAALALLLLSGGTLWWTQRLQREVKARRRSEDLLTDIAANMPGVAYRYVVDKSGQLTHHFYSSAAQRFLGRDLDSKLTVLAAMGPFMDPEEREQVTQAQTRSLATGEPFKATSAMPTPTAAPAGSTPKPCARRAVPTAGCGQAFWWT
jgi:two-component system sensor histidine kinase EvgS